MGRMVAFCGVVCTDCPAYQATQSGDQRALAEVLAEWREAFHAPEITTADILCDGCLTPDGRLNGYCQHCAVRPCGMGRGVDNCAGCDAYGCEKLERLLGVCDKLEEGSFFGYARSARDTLEGLRAGQRRVQRGPEQ